MSHNLVELDNIPYLSLPMVLNQFCIKLEFSLEELSLQCNLPEDTILQIIYGNKEIDIEISKKLGVRFNQNPMFFYSIQQDSVLKNISDFVLAINNTINIKNSIVILDYCLIITEAENFHYQIVLRHILDHDHINIETNNDIQLLKNRLKTYTLSQE